MCFFAVCKDDKTSLCLSSHRIQHGGRRVPNTDGKICFLLTGKEYILFLAEVEKKIKVALIKWINQLKYSVYVLLKGIGSHFCMYLLLLIYSEDICFLAAQLSQPTCFTHPFRQRAVMYGLFTCCDSALAAILSTGNPT